MMQLMANCCELCTHSLAHPCSDYISCRTMGPLCHSKPECRVEFETEIDRIMFGDSGLRINIGMSTCGLAAGAQQIYNAIVAEIKNLGINAALFILVGAVVGWGFSLFWRATGRTGGAG